MTARLTAGSLRNPPINARMKRCVIRLGSSKIWYASVVPVPVEHLVAQRHPLARHHQCDAHSACSRADGLDCEPRRACGLPQHLPLEVRAGHVVQAAGRSRAQTARRSRCLRCCSMASLCGSNRSSARYSRSSFDVLGRQTQMSSSAVPRYQSSAMCSSLDGSHSRAITSTAAIVDHGTVSRPAASAPRRARPASAPATASAQPHVAEAPPALHTHLVEPHRDLSRRRPRSPRTARAERCSAGHRQRQSRALARPCASSSPSCATVSCTTLPSRRTDRTRRQ